MINFLTNIKLKNMNSHIIKIKLNSFFPFPKVVENSEKLRKVESQSSQKYLSSFLKF